MPFVGAVPDGARLIAVLGGLPAADGVPVIGSESLIIPRQTVGDNALLGAEGASGFFPRKRDLDRRATDLLDLVGLAVAPATPVSDLDIVDQRIVQLARSLSRTPEFVLVDDRSIGFNAEEIRRWYAAVARAAQVVPMVVAVDGLAGLEQYPVDVVVVVRGGEVIGTARPDESDRLLEMLVGDDDSPARPARVFGPVVLELRDVAVSHPIHHDRLVIEGASLTVRAGEIVGLAGAESLVLGIFGASSGGRVSGSILLDGSPADLSTVDRAIASRVLFISEHPPVYDVGLIGGIPTSVSGEKLARLARMGLIDSRKEYVPRRAPSMLLEVIPGARSRPSTSAMNDVLAGWAANPPRVALLTEPFSGLSPSDRETRRDLIERIAEAGAAVVLEASEAAQLVGLCDRFLVQRGTRLTAELAGEDATLRGLATLSIRFDVQR
ncbi:MAG: hypothetical protein ABWX82_15775 [Leifsonia sp.]